MEKPLRAIETRRLVSLLEEKVRQAARRGPGITDEDVHKIARDTVALVFIEVTRWLIDETGRPANTTAQQAPTTAEPRR